MERPADVLAMNGRAVKQSAFLRADAAIRRMPGLGILIALFLAGDLYAQGSYILLAGLVVGVAGVLADEFFGKR